MILQLLIVAILVGFSSVSAESYVQIPRHEFVTALGSVDVIKKQLTNADQQIKLYVTLSNDQKKLIELNRQHIVELEGIVEQYEKVGKTHVDILPALKGEDPARETHDELIQDLSRKLETADAWSIWKTYGRAL